MTTAPTDRQISYAHDLQTNLIEKGSWTWDNDVMRRVFLPEKNQELQAQVRAARAEGRTEDARQLRQQVKQLQRDEADQAMDAYRARRSELANVDLSTLDCEELSAWIDAAKQHRV